MLRLRSSLARIESGLSRMLAPTLGATFPRDEGARYLFYSKPANEVGISSLLPQRRTISTTNFHQNNEDPQSTPTTFGNFDNDSYQISPSIRRRPYNLEAKMRMKQYRREAEQQRRQRELEEEERTFQLDYSKMYKIGDPGTVTAVIKEIVNVGYITALPDGTEGFLAAMHLGCSGGITLLTRLMPVGTEVAVRVIKVPHPGGRHRCYVRP